MDFTEFNIGFWHPFGPHAGESRYDILERKKREIHNNGWTFWSFQYRNTDLWIKELSQFEDKIYVLCSDSLTTTDPKGQVVNCSEYKTDVDSDWTSIPYGISVPHPKGNKPLASAFVVRRIFINTEIHQPTFKVSWFSTMNQEWRNDSLPTRGEYLIKKGGNVSLRKIYAVLELNHLYIVTLR